MAQRRHHRSRRPSCFGHLPSMRRPLEGGLVMVAFKKPQRVELLNDLESMLTRLKLTAIREQLGTLLDQAGRAELNLREALAML